MYQILILSFIISSRIIHWNINKINDHLPEHIIYQGKYIWFNKFSRMTFSFSFGSFKLNDIKIILSKNYMELNGILSFKRHFIKMYTSFRALELNWIWALHSFSLSLSYPIFLEHPVLTWGIDNHQEDCLSSSNQEQRGSHPGYSSSPPYYHHHQHSTCSTQ